MSPSMCSDFVIEPGRIADASRAAELIVETDLTLFSWYGDGDPSLWRDITEWERRAESGIYSYTMSQVVRQRGTVVGLLVSYSPARGAQIDWSLGAAHPHIEAGRWARLAELRPLSNFLFAAIPGDAYYVQNLVIDPTARGCGLAKRLMEQAFSAGQAAGCRSCHLDVSSTNPAVDFYQGLGMYVAVETVVPALQRRGISSHYRMVKWLAAAAPNRFMA